MNVTEALAPDRASDPVSARALPLSARKVDLAIVVFYAVNLLFITYVVDLEQLVLPDLSRAWTYPAWPPRAAIDLVHWYGTNFDPVLIARPVWWKMTIAIDAVFFGPYYAVALWAFVKGKDWIRIPSIVQSSFLIAIVIIILGEETWGEHATPHRLFVYLDNLPWLVFPMIVIARMARAERPFAARGAR